MEAPWVPKKKAAFIQTPQDFFNVSRSDGRHQMVSSWARLLVRQRAQTRPQQRSRCRVLLQLLFIPLPTPAMCRCVLLCRWMPPIPWCTAPASFTGPCCKAATASVPAPAAVQAWCSAAMCWCPLAARPTAPSLRTSEWRLLGCAWRMQTVWCIAACPYACMSACLPSIVTLLLRLQLSHAHRQTEMLLHWRRLSRSAYAAIVTLDCCSRLLLCSNTAMTLMSAGMATM